MILVFDTETSTFPSSSLPANHPNQARIVQLAWVLLDESFQERACFNSLIKVPSTVKIAEGAFKAHGITVEDCQKYGCTLNSVMSPFFEHYINAQVVVAHNVKFDKQLISVEHEIMFGDKFDTEPLNMKASEFCTMEAMTSVCQLPFVGNKRWGNQKYKWPTLQEAHQHAFGQKFEGAHDALADVRATAHIYRWIKEKEQFNNLPAQLVKETQCQAPLNRNSQPLSTNIA